ncbi:MAG: hypothetical protein AAF411_29820, partial [Myxococcota bacterium]
MGGRLSELLEAKLVRRALALAIVHSLLPHPALDRLWPYFLGLFTVEFVLRLLFGKRTWSSALFLIVDFVALLSFVPAHWIGAAPGAVRLLRLALLVMLLRFTRELAQDVYRVLTRREQVRQLSFVTASVFGLSFVAAVLMHAFAWPGPPPHFAEQVWWAFRQVESPDNLVPTLEEHPAVIALSLGLTIIGIFVFSYLIGLGTTIVEQVLAAEKRRPVPYERHTIITGPLHGTESMVDEFVRIYTKNAALRRLRLGEFWRWLRGKGPKPRRHALPRITLLGEREPGFLYEPRMRWVVHRQGKGANGADLRLAGAPKAKRAVILSDPREGDAAAVATLSALRAQNTQADVFVEVQHPETAELARDIGGTGTFVLDAPHFVGLFLAHHLTVPRAREVFAELMSADGNEMYTHFYVDGGESLRAKGTFAEVAR